jgi:hypothetical protein
MRTVRSIEVIYPPSLPRLASLPADSDPREQFLELNAEFYNSEPHKYFRKRLVDLLGQYETSTPEMKCSFAVLGGIPVDLNQETYHDRSTIEIYVAMESQILLHHTSEALLRLFIAHLGDPACPWYELASCQLPGQFKERVQSEILDSNDQLLRKRVAHLLLGRWEAGTDEHDLAESSEGLAIFLRSFASIWLADAPLYNSLKHGLAVQPQRASLTLSFEDGDQIEMDSGIAFCFLESRKLEKSVSQWLEVSQWTDTPYALRMTNVACHMIASLWQVAKSRHGGDLEPFKAFNPGKLRPADLRSGSSGTTRMTVPAIYETREQVDGSKSDHSGNKS